MSNIVIKQYNGIDIPFGKGENVWLNATKAAEVFGKQAREFFSNKNTVEYLNALAEAHGYAVGGIPPTGNPHNFTTKDLSEMFPQFIRIQQGGTPEKQGTWISKELVVNYSRWLNAKFAVWCDIQIRELLENGNVSISAKLPTNYAAALRELADTVEEKIRLELENAAMQPKAIFYDTVIQSDDEFDMHQVAKILSLGFGRNSLFEKLRTDGILMDDNSPYQKYVDGKYFRLVESTYIRPDGTQHVGTKTVCTQKGLDFINRRYNPKYAIRP